MSPYGLAPMSLEGISCGVLQTPNTTLESSQAALTNSSTAATVITAQAAARAANGASSLSLPCGLKKLNQTLKSFRIGNETTQNYREWIPEDHFVPGATLLSPPVPSVCHILPISPMMSADSAATAAVDSTDNTLLFNVTLDDSSVILQQQECDVIE